MAGDEEGTSGGSTSGSESGSESGSGPAGVGSSIPSSESTGSNPTGVRRKEDEESQDQPVEDRTDYDPAKEGEYQAIPSPHTPPQATNNPFEPGGMPPSLPAGEMFDSTQASPADGSPDIRREESAEPSFAWDSAPPGESRDEATGEPSPLDFAGAAKELLDFTADPTAGTTAGLLGSTSESNTPESTVSPMPMAPPVRSSFPVLLFTWASIATLLAVYLYWTRPPQPGYLENLHYNELERKQFKMPTDELSVRQVIPLGETRRLGNVEVTPLAVDRLTVRILAPLAEGNGEGELQEGEKKDLAEPNVRSEEALALTMRIKNVSQDQRFRVAEPQYTFGKRVRGSMKRLRQFNAAGLFVKTYSFAHAVNNLEEVLLPLDVEGTGDEVVEGQDYPLLGPGEEAEVRFLVQAPLEPNSAMMFRALICKGVAQNGFPVAAVVGVPFTPQRGEAATK